jgi:hypothetical protein
MNPAAAIPQGVLGETAKLAGQPHPVVTKEAVDRYDKILLECCEAQLAWRTGS